MKQIWQCRACGHTYMEYINGCVHHGDDKTPHPVELMLEVT